jgi:DNA-binding MarR family transcriptional regulator
MSAEHSLPRLPCACASLRRAARAVTRAYEAELRDTGLKPTQFTLLWVLARKGPKAQGELGGILAIDSTTLSRTLRPLEEAGWIRAGPGDDARQTRWSLTPAGRGRVEHATPAWERAQASLRTRLGAAQWGRLLSDLATVASAVREDA